MMAPTTEHRCATHASYQLSCEEFDALRAITPGRCHWCGRATARLEIDHDHAVGGWAVRGLLCRSCNRRVRLVEDGIHPRTDDVERYLRNAWHLSQASSADKRRRARPKAPCPACGLVCAVTKSGRPTVHYSRLPGRSQQICPGKGGEDAGE